MKSVSATFFVILYVLAMVRPVMPLFEYVIDQDYIVDFLCINKDKVELQCNGKCYLMQQLDKQNEEKKQSLPGIAMEEYPIGFVNFLSVELPEKKIRTKTVSKQYTNHYNFLFSGQSFHPPTALV